MEYSKYIRFYADREHAVMKNDAGFFFPELLVNDASAEIFVSVEKEENKNVKLHLRYYWEDGSLLTNLVFGNPRKSVPLGAGSFPVPSTRRTAFVTRRTAVMSHEDFLTLISEKTICIAVGSVVTAEFALSIEPTKFVLFLACVLGWDQLTETSRSIYIRFYADREHAVMENDAGFFFPELLVNDASAEIFVSVEKDEDKKVKLHLRNYSEDGSLLTDDANLVFGNPRKSVPLGTGSFPVASTRRNAFVTRRTAVMSHEDFQTLISEKTICIEVGSETAEFALSFEPTKLVLFLACVLGWDQLTETSRSVLVPLFEREIKKDQKKDEERNIENEKKASLISKIARLLMKEMFEDRSQHLVLEYVSYNLSDLETAFKKVIEREHIQVNFDWVNSISVVDISHFLQSRFSPLWCEHDLNKELYCVSFEVGYLSSQQLDDAWEGKISPGDLTLMNEMGYLINRHLDHDGKLEFSYNTFNDNCERLKNMGLVHCSFPSVECEVTDYEQACELISCEANKRKEFLEERKKNKEKKEQRGAKVEKIGCLIEIISVLIFFIIGWDIDGIYALIFLIVIPIITAIARRIIAYIIRRR